MIIIIITLVIKQKKYLLTKKYSNVNGENKEFVIQTLVIITVSSYKLCNFKKKQRIVDHLKIIFFSTANR